MSGLRIALAGKGGAGKTTIAAALARVLARQGREVVAIDADSNPNLGTSLGLVGRLPAALPVALVSRRLDGPRMLGSVRMVLDEHAVVGPDGVRLALMGMPAHAEEGCMCAAHATVSALLSDLGTEDGFVTIVDMEASPEHLSRGTARHVDELLLVAEPYYRSLETARRMAALAGELPIPRVAVLGNKLRSPDDAAALSEFCARHDLALAGAVPWSEGVLEADRATAPLVDRSPGDPAVTAVRALADALTGTAGR